MNYNPSKIEKKWQKYWEKVGLYRAKDFSKKPKKYILIEFPYPSGEGLHVGHVRSYSALDAVARKKRMEGFNVLYPIGWDAFGLPTENYAIRTGVHPQVATTQNIANFTRQLKNLGLSFDWSREINTADPKYYKWTQWIFLKFFEKGLAYQAEIPVNWCPSCKIGLANEEVAGGCCERCGATVGKKALKQWMLKITAYADRLIEDLEKVNYLEKIKTQQINWIGKSEGTTIKFKIENCKLSRLCRGSSIALQSGKIENCFIEVFTTRADTIFGVTAIVLAPEHPIVVSLLKIKNQKLKIKNFKEVEGYIKKAEEKSEFERTKLEKEKTGVILQGIYAVNPVNNEKIPIWVGDYVVAAYGGGAVMTVPAHDYRDYDFAKKYGLEIREVVSGGDISKEAFVNYGILINSDQFSGLSSEKAIKKITQWLKKRGFGGKTVKYKLRDWVFSRQHYWGEPIPLIFCENCKKLVVNSKFSRLCSDFVENARLCRHRGSSIALRSGEIRNSKSQFTIGELLNPGWIALDEKDLPLKLPKVKKYQPTGTGESPLAAISEWVNTKCPKCGGPAKRETDTMPNWAGSNWYYMRYVDPQNDKAIADPKKLKYWMPVDWYNGGMEHTTLHLLYSRFVYKFLYDIGITPTPEPYQRRTSHGMVLAEDGRKMSKSFGNVVNPDDIVKKYGADTLRIYEMFMGPFDQAIVWSVQGVKGARRFLERVWKLVLDCYQNKKSNLRILQTLNKLNKKIDQDLETTKFNTAIAGFMEFINLSLDNEKEVGRDALERMLILLSPFVPHLAEELWEKLGHKKSIFLEKWPVYDPELIQEEEMEMVIEINGKVRDKIKVKKDISKEEAEEMVLGREKIKKYLEGKEIKKIIFVSNRLINFVV